MRKGSLLFGLAILAVGCGGSGGGSDSGIENPEVRFVNGAVDVASLEFRVNDRTEATVTYGEGNSNGFRSFKPETYDVMVRVPGQAEDAWAETWDAGQDNDYVIASYGLQSFGELPTKRLRFGKFQIDRNPPNGNKARLIVLNAFNREAGVENVPVDFKNPGENPQFQLTNIAFGDATNFTVDSGSQTFDVRLTNAEQVFVSETLQLEAGKVYFVILGGTENGTGTQAPDIKLVELQTETD